MLDADEVAQLRQFERLAVQGRGHAARGGAEQDPLQARVESPLVAGCSAGGPGMCVPIASPYRALS